MVARRGLDKVAREVGRLGRSSAVTINAAARDAKGAAANADAAIGEITALVGDADALPEDIATTVGNHEIALADLRAADDAIDLRLDVAEGWGWPLPAGSYFDQALNAVAKSTIAGAANRLDLMPYLGDGKTLQSIGLEVTTGVASAQARVGIYADAAGLPAALLADSGVLDCSTTGVKSGAVSITLAVGVRYWLAVLSSSTQTYRGVPVAALQSLGIPAAGGTTVFTLRRATQTFASGLPSTGPAGTLTSAIAPVVMMRLV